MSRLTRGRLSRLLAVVVALTGLALVPATAAQAATVCKDKYGSYWNRGPYTYAGLSASLNQGRNMFLDAASPYPTTAPGNVHLWHDNGPTTNQQWCLGRFTYTDGSYAYQVRNYYTGLCLDPDSPVGNYVTVWLWTCKSSTDTTQNTQMWEITANGSRSTPSGTHTVYYFRRSSSIYCLDVRDDVKTDDAKLQTWQCSYTNNQLFY
ncbi:RICIN domain-containing protein [Paractinoplanes durhamensis]|uniref:Ricin B lectin domain-containing protein n=1 Tax=Paractinoplanes durhamensis TaxID=113563 RepID=A0ABQ3Z718_9ACTN|nr:RICIN domain-containing protein [Actinoplanes durhamensis]GIE05632.1 hypothetical protein Adu01nite_69820 [Actinoplanes durhamensis]